MRSSTAPLLAVIATIVVAVAIAVAMPRDSSASNHSSKPINPRASLTYAGHFRPTVSYMLRHPKW